MIQCITIKNRKVIFYGHYNDVIAIIKKFELLDIVGLIGISADGFAPTRNDIKFINKAELIHVDLSDSMIIVLNEYEESAKDFINRFNIDVSCFAISMEAGLYRLNYNTVYDPNIGFNVDNGFVYLSTDCIKNAKRIGVLGDSNASMQWSEKTWMEYMIDYANRQNVNIEIYNGSVGSYIAGQSLIKLVRDMSHMNLDMIILYSGTVETGGIQENYFIHGYQKHIFEKLEQIKSKGIYYGEGIKDRVGNYFHQLRMMNSICKEFSIKFYSILSPALLLKNPLNNKDIELMEHIFLSFTLKDNRTDLLRSIRGELSIKDCSYLKDFTNVFDNGEEAYFKDMYHLFNNGNSIIAKKILNLISNDCEFYGE